MQDATGTTTYTYDELYRLKSMTNPYGQVISYEYDANGNVTKLTYPGNKSVTYTYNKLNRLQTVKNWILQTATYTYDDAGRLTSLTNFNGTVTNYTYDNANRLVSLQNKPSSTVPVISSYSFTLDGNGNRTRVIQEEPLMPAMPLESIDYNYNSVKNRLLSAGLTNFTYDDEGQLASKSSDTYSFDYEHRLKTVIANPSGEAISFTYDGGGNRLEAIRNGVVTRYIYDARGNLLAEADSANTIQRYYIYGLGLLAMNDTATGQVYTYHYNGIGSTIAMTDQNKNMVNKYFYTAFGMLTNQQETIPQPFKYVAQYGIMYEPGGLYYMRARYYDAETGRFISEDPVGFDGGINLYAYVNNNPINFVDPWGLEAGGKSELSWWGTELDAVLGALEKLGERGIFVQSRNPATGLLIAGHHLENPYQGLGGLASKVAAPLAIVGTGAEIRQIWSEDASALNKSLKSITAASVNTLAFIGAGAAVTGFTASGPGIVASSGAVVFIGTLGENIKNKIYEHINRNIN